LKSDCVSTNLLTWLRWAPLVALLAAMPAHAQYKVIGADGKVTYTDRPPAQSDGKVTAINGRNAQPAAAVSSDNSGLPLELRQSMGRYPVTLYTVTGACEPCSSARALLKQRGIPFAEKQVMSPEDSDALERISGGRDAPTLSIGAQTLRGLAPEVWNSYLDAAGYPRASQLPATYQYAAATSIVERREANVAGRSATAASGPSPTPATVAPPPSPSGIKF
jgi:glutaredoxin